MLRTLLELGRISNLPTVWTNLLAGWVIAGGLADTKTHLPPLLWLCVAGSLFFWGGMALNDAFGAKWDADHKPERPIPAGRISEKTVFLLGFGCLAVGVALIGILRLSNLPAALVLCANIVIYNVNAKKWKFAFLSMSIVRVMLYVLGAYVVTENPNVTFPALVLGVYVAAITIIARSEDLRGGKLSVIGLLLLLVPPIILIPFPIELKSLLFPALFIAWILYAQSILRKGGANIGKGVGLLLAGMVLVDAIAIAPHSTPLALGVAACLPLLLLWQRFIAAT